MPTTKKLNRQVVRVIPRQDGPLRGHRQAVLDAFDSMGVTGEGMSSPVNMVALDIAPGVDLTAVKGLLKQGEQSGQWHFEEGSTSQEWRELG